MLKLTSGKITKMLQKIAAKVDKALSRSENQRNTEIQALQGHDIEVYRLKTQL